MPDGEGHQSSMTIADPGPRLRWLVILAVVVGAAYWLVGQGVSDRAANITFKGACVGLLTIWAAANARGSDGWLLVAVLALGTLGDVLLEAAGVTTGALAFLAGHVAAIILYLRHRRARLTPSQLGLAIVLLIAIPVIAWLLPSDRSAAPGIALYATGLGAMAASAWSSRFPRYRVGLGAVLFAISDLLIFARMGPLFNSDIPGILIWPLYFAGQTLIAWGGVVTLLRWRADEDLHHRL
jgi:uncharacterized membrane protein YhhN